MTCDYTEDIDRVLSQYRTVAVVGASADPDRPSNMVAGELKAHGFRMIPVTPKGGEIHGEKAYSDLSSIPEKIDVVDIFRRPEDVPPIVDEAIAVGAKVVWMQEGIVNEEAAAKAREAGLTVIMDHCMKTETENREGEG
jgi:predicted CoA-binding protein